MMPERHFWRRFFASGIDMLVLPLLVLCPVIIILALFLGRMPTLGPAGCVYYLDKPTADRIELIIKPAPLERLRFITCPFNDGVAGAGRLVTVTVISLGLTSTYPRILTYRIIGSTIEEAQAPRRDYLPIIGLIAALPIVFAFFDSKGRQTPGKKLTRLYIRRTDNTDPGFSQSLIREYSRFLPIIGFAVIGLGLPQFETQRQILSDILRYVESGDPRQVPALLFILVGGQLALMLAFIGPASIWRGQAWYDRLAGTYVAKGRNSRATLPVRA